MPDKTLPERLRADADEVPLDPANARRVMYAAADELSERAGRICELTAENARLRRDVGDMRHWERLAGQWQEIAEERGVELEGLRAEVERLQGLVSVEPRRRVVLIRAPDGRPYSGDLDAIVRCGPVDAAWRLRAVHDCSAPGAEGSLFRVELEPVDAHDVPLDVPVRELPFPLTDVGWIPADSLPPLDEAMTSPTTDTKTTY